MSSPSTLKTHLGTDQVRPRGLRRLRVLAALLTMSVIAAGCMVGPTYVQPSVEEPSHFKSQAVSEAGPPVFGAFYPTISPDGRRVAVEASESEKVGSRIFPFFEEKLGIT